jgi:hypothetical protein
MVHLAAWLEEGSDKVVIDETKLPGAYDFILVEDPRNGITINESLEAIGLELCPAKRKVAGIYVDTTGLPAPVRVVPVKEGYTKISMPWSTLDRSVSR